MFPAAVIGQVLMRTILSPQVSFYVVLCIFHVSSSSHRIDTVVSNSIVILTVRFKHSVHYTAELYLLIA